MKDVTEGMAVKGAFREQEIERSVVLFWFCADKLRRTQQRTSVEPGISSSCRGPNLCSTRIWKGTVPRGEESRLGKSEPSAEQSEVTIPTNSAFSGNPAAFIERLAAMRAPHLSDTGIRMEVDVEELRILATALNLLCNGENTLDDLEERLSGAKDKAENLLIAFRSLASLFDHLMILCDESSQEPAEDRSASAGSETELASGPAFTAFLP